MLPRAQDAVAETASDEAAHLLAALLQLQVQELRRRQLGRSPVAHAPGEVAALHRAGGGQMQVAGRPAQNTQGIDQAAIEVVGAAHLLGLRRLQNPLAGERLQRPMHARRAQRRVRVAVANLQHLHRVFHVHQGAGAELGVAAFAGAVLGELPAPHCVHVGERYRFGAIHQFIAQPFQARAEHAVAGTERSRISASRS